MGYAVLGAQQWQATQRSANAGSDKRLFTRAQAHERERHGNASSPSRRARRRRETRQSSARITEQDRTAAKLVLGSPLALAGLGAEQATTAAAAETDPPRRGVDVVAGQRPPVGAGGEAFRVSSF
jgi:hypothetical protein